MTDRIVLSLPTNPSYRAVATLVLGGLGGRIGLPYERVDDLQLAVLSALEATAGADVSLEVDTDERGLLVAIGPLRAGSAADEGLGRVLSRLVDEIDGAQRDDGEWLTLRVVNDRPLPPTA